MNNSETKSTSETYPQFKLFNRINLLNIIPAKFDNLYLICFWVIYFCKKNTS